MKYSGYRIQRTATIPSFIFIKWPLHQMASPLYMTITDHALTIVP